MSKTAAGRVAVAVAKWKVSVVGVVLVMLVARGIQFLVAGH